jgi:Phage derived protein Gp49-like (DUF891)
MSSEHLKLLLSGDKFKIYGLVVNGTCEAEDFLEGLSEYEKNKITPPLVYTANTGLLRNEQKFKNIGEDIFEFKGFQSRLLCFFDKGRIIILSHGCIKKRDKLDPAEIKKAIKRKEEYFRKGGKK